MNIFTPILSFFDHLHHFLWSPVMLATFFAIGCSYTIQTHFFQFRFFFSLVEKYDGFSFFLLSS